MANDIQFDEDGDTLITNGDFAIGESSQREIDDIFTLDKGQIRQTGTIGVGMLRLIKSSINASQIKQEIALNLKLDGKRVSNLKIEKGKVSGDVENL